jgi:divalent metal cation (Fe/Co/Zn/Cd) transporter
MDRAPDPRFEAEVRRIAREVEGVEGLHRCYVRKMGLDFYVDLDVLVRGEISVQDGHDIAHKVQERIKTSNRRIRKVYIHVEPASAERMGMS